MKNYIHLEYIWLDGNEPQQIRSKTKIVEKLESREDLFKSYKSNPGLFLFGILMVHQLIKPKLLNQNC